MRWLIMRSLAILLGIIAVALLPRLAIADEEYWVKLSYNMVRAGDNQWGQRFKFHGHTRETAIFSWADPEHFFDFRPSNPPPPPYDYTLSPYYFVTKGSWGNDGSWNWSRFVVWNYSVTIADEFRVGMRPDPTVFMGPTLTDTEHDDFNRYDVTVSWTTWVWYRVTIDIPEPPIAADQDVTTRHDESVSINLLTNASGGPARGAQIVSSLPPAQGTVELVGHVAEFAPANGFEGTASFRFTLWNDDGTSNTATARIRVTPAPPIAANQNARTVSPSAVTIDLAGGAGGGRPTAARIISQPPAAEGIARVSGMNAVFVPAATFTGVSNFAFALSNSGGVSNTATARVTVVKPFQVRSLNPFWTYPSGASSVDVAKIAREINAPGSSPGTYPSGSASATKIASDGVSRIIIGLKTYSRSTATVSLASGSPGSLLALNGALFRTPAGVQRSMPLSAFTPVPGGKGAMTGAVVYVAPETPDNSPAHKPVIINVTQDGQTKTVTLDLVPPPVLLVHGIWSGPDTWWAWLTSLRSEFPVVQTADYRKANWIEFDKPLVQMFLSTDISNTLDETRRKGVVAAQVNLVGHSMGGLISRVFANTISLWLPGNFYAGYVNAIITIDSVHRGTHIADILWTFRGASLRLDANYVAAKPSTALLRLAMSAVTNPVVTTVLAAARRPVAGSVASLRPGSPSLNKLNSQSFQFPYEAVAAYDDSFVPSQIEILFNFIFEMLGLPSVDLIYSGANNDVLVPVDSQKAGSTPGIEPIQGLVHANLSSSSPISVLNSPAVVNYVKCRLLHKTACTAAAGAAAEQAQTERVPVDGFSLAGLTRVSGNTLTLSGIPTGGLLVNVPRALTLRSSTRTLTHFLALIDDGTSTWFTGDNVDPKIRLTATTLKPIVVRVVATFSDRTYAIQKWTLQPAATFSISALSFDDAVVRIKRGTSYPLRLVATLNAPAAGTLDVTSRAAYTSKPGASGIARVSSSGMLTAAAPGTTWVRGSYKGRSATTTIIVSP